MKMLSPDELKRLSFEDQHEYLLHLEALLMHRGKEKIMDFCHHIEVPGAPVSDPEPEIYYPIKLKPAKHHKLILRAIQSLADGEADDVDGIMLFLPPGSAKSTYASVVAPAWLLGRKPGSNVIMATYGQDLATRFGRRVRHIVKTKEYETIMGCRLRDDNQAVNEWGLTNGSDYKAVGIGGGVTGLRADWLIIDDPVKNREDADSETIREKTWSGFVDDLTSRYKPNMKIFVIMTRWHEDDLAGRVLGEEWKGQSGHWRGTDHRLWYIINLPMEAEYDDDPLGRQMGERLWPEFFEEKLVARLKKAAEGGGTAARSWSSLYQQRPAPNEGSILRRADWQPWKKTGKDGQIVPPECEFVILSYDTAFEEDEESDYSAMSAWGVFASTSTKKTGEQYHHQHVILLGSWRGKVSAIDLADIVQDHYKHFKPNLILVEKRASGHTVIQELKRLRLPVKQWLPKGKPGSKGKIPRAHGVAMILEQGAVHYIPGPNNNKLIEECSAFPYAVNDDWVDTVTCALTYFRDRFMFQTADEEMDEKERLEAYDEKFKQPARRRLYGSTFNIRDEDDPSDRMTDDTKRRLYGG